MIISFKQEVWDDVFSNSKWPIFTQTEKQTNIIISLLENLCKATECPESIDCLDEVCALKVVEYIYNNHNLSNYDIYLFVSHSAWIQRNRVSNYKKLWKSLPKKLNVSSFLLGSELCFESNKGIRCAGIARVYKNSFLDAIKVLRANRSSLMFLTENKKFDCEDQVKMIFNAAFKNENVTSIDWSSLSLDLCREGNILVRLSGSQDERESSLELIMKKEKLMALMKG